MKTIQLFTLFILLSLQAGATGYSHNMFVAHKKLQAGTEKSTICEHEKASKPEKVAVRAKVTVKAKQEVSLTRQISHRLSGVATLNQRIVEQGSASFFTSEDEEEMQSSVISKFVGLVKGMVFSFLSSISLN